MSNGLENLKYLSKKRKKPNEGKLKLFPKKLFLNIYLQKKKINIIFSNRFKQSKYLYIKIN